MTSKRLTILIVMFGLIAGCAISLAILFILGYLEMPRLIDTPMFVIP